MFVMIERNNNKYNHLVWQIKIEQTLAGQLGWNKSVTFVQKGKRTRLG